MIPGYESSVASEEATMLSAIYKLSAKSFIICMIAVVLLSCNSKSTDVEFDLTHPPDGWYRYESSSERGYVIWLPPDWEVGGGQVEDVLVPNFYNPIGDVDTEVGVLRLNDPIDFRTVTRDPIRWQDGGREVLPDYIYELHISDLAIPCARYYHYEEYYDKHFESIKHICVIGSDNSTKYYAIALGAKVDMENQFMAVWRKIVAGFVLEQLSSR